MENNQIKVCPECNEPLKGRSDKKYCSDLCRNSYNNKQHSDLNKKLTTINSILKKNRQILERLINKGIDKAEREELLLEGFNFRYATTFDYNPDGSYRYFCYEYGYHTIGDNRYNLIEREE
jgi:hypothetical protein